MFVRSQVAKDLIDHGYVINRVADLMANDTYLYLTVLGIIGSMHPRTEYTSTDNALQPWLVKAPPRWFALFWVGVGIACLNLNASSHKPRRAEWVAFTTWQAAQLNSIAQQPGMTAVYTEFQQQHKACTEAFTGLYGDVTPKELQPVVSLVEEYLKHGAIGTGSYDSAGCEHHQLCSPCACRTQPQQVPLSPYIPAAKLVATPMGHVCVDALLAHFPDFHLRPSWTNPGFDLSQSLLTDTLDVMLQIAHVSATGNMRVGHVPSAMSSQMQMDPAWDPKGICGAQRVEGAAPGANWDAIRGFSLPHAPIMLFQGLTSFGEADMVLMPLHYFEHFIVVVYFVAAGRIVHFDSVNRGRLQVTTAQEEVMMEFAKRFIINKEWAVEMGSTEEQDDSFSCGYRAFILCRTIYNARDM
ncbi:hypothetical protein V8C86DRAFT_2446212 [Haematococcus lacustris]